MWATIGVIAFLLFGLYAFVELTGFRTRVMNRHTERTAESMYDKRPVIRRRGGCRSTNRTVSPST